MSNAEDDPPTGGGPYELSKAESSSSLMRPLAKYKDLLLASTMDGRVHALDKYSGRLLWSLGDLGGPLLQGDSLGLPPASAAEQSDYDGWGLSREAIFLVEPLFPGGLYSHVPGEVLQKMPVSLKNLVNQSPVRWPDGTLFVGRKTTDFYVLDLGSGQMAFHLSPHDAPEQARARRGDDAFQRATEDPDRFLFLARTDYQLTAYRMDSPPRKFSFSEFSGIRNPTMVWKQQLDRGEFFELGVTDQDGKADPEVSLFSSFSGLVYARDRKNGNLLWAQRFDTPTVAFLQLAGDGLDGGTEIVPYDPASMSSPATFVNIPIDNVAGDEFPDEKGEISHPLDVPSASTAFPGKKDDTYIDLVNIGEVNGVFYVLPHEKFPRFRRPRSIKKPAAEPEKGTSLMRKQDHFYDSWNNHHQHCFPGDEDWPHCLTGAPQYFYERVPVPMLDSSRLPSKSSGFGAIAWTGILGLLLLALAFYAPRLWRRLRPRRTALPPAPPQLRKGPLPPTAGDLSQSSVRSRPPGFEEITLTSADYFYQVQGYSADNAESAPRSFIVTDQVLGYGSHGTVVFKGKFDGRDVAVKRMLIDFYDVAGHEVSLLQQSDNHPNVIRYFCREQTERFMYIVLELCPASLAEVIERPEAQEILELFPPEKPIVKQRILKEVILGLEHLHSTKLVHRDLKPANILISPTQRVLLSDFGLSKKLADDQSSFHATVQSGTIGWRAPECILNDEVAKMKATPEMTTMPKGIKITKAIDIFAAGCIFYYVLTDGKHPFGGRMHRELNIVQNSEDLSGLDAQPLAKDLARRMISRDPLKRPTATQVLAHPYFWDAPKRLAFLLDVSDHIERENRHIHPSNKAIESKRSVIYNGQPAWSAVVDPIFWEDLSKFRKYFGNSVQDLLRAMRNKRHHFQELDPALKALLGESAEAYLGYFERHFPQLLLQVYMVLETSPFRQVHPFKDVYFVDI